MWLDIEGLNCAVAFVLLSLCFRAGTEQFTCNAFVVFVTGVGRNRRIR